MTEVDLHQAAISEEMGSLPPLLTGGLDVSHFLLWSYP